VPFWDEFGSGLVLDWYDLDEEVAMSGRILKRGDAWQLRVYL
jgi:hypothetical protein